MTKQKNQAIERIRAFALFDILYLHLHNWFPSVYPWFPGSQHTMDLFFVISGYMVAQTFLKTLPPVGNHVGFWSRLGFYRREILYFYWRRLFRVVPLAGVCLLLVLVVYRSVPELTSQYEFLTREAMAIVQLWYNYFFASHYREVVGFYWTLTVEEHFYLLLPLFMMVFFSNRDRIIASVGGALLVFLVSRPLTQMYVSNPDFIRRYLFAATHCRAGGIFLGVALYLFRSRYVRPLRLHPAVFAGLSWMCFLALLLLERMNFAQSAVGARILWVDLICVGLVFLATYDPPSVLSIPGLERFFQHVASRAYGFYLVQIPLMKIFSLHWAEGISENRWIWTPLYLGAVFVSAEILHRVIEKPCMDLGKHLAFKFGFSARKVALA